MKTWASSMPIVFDELPVFQANFSAGEEDAVIFVDVGGNTGHQCEEVLRRYPELGGRVVFQDLPKVIDEAPKQEGVKKMAQDIFEKQPIQGATVYYMRHVLHDWTDEKALKILANIKDAMNDGSTLMIDEVVVPDTRAYWRITALEMLLMAGNGVVERTKTEWSKLIEKAGLHVAEVHEYSPASGHAIIECML